MEQSKVKVSVIIPNYNYAKYIRSAIASLQSQTLKEIEIIVVDDCSSDKSVEIVREMQQKDPRIKLIVNERNSGAGESRNVGIAAATGEYIRFLDADDTMNKDVLETMYTTAVDNGVNIVCGNMMNANANGVPNTLTPFAKYLRSQLHGKILTPEEAEKNSASFIFDTVGIGDCLYKRSLFDDIKFPKLKWEDFATIPIVKFREGRILYINITVYNYRQYSQNTTGTDQTHKTAGIMDIILGAQNLRENMPSQYQDKVDYKEFMHTLSRISNILDWKDCSIMHKAVLISALFGCLNADVKNIYDNPYMEQRFPTLRLVNAARKRLRIEKSTTESQEQGDMQDTKKTPKTIDEVIDELKEYQNIAPTINSQHVAKHYNSFMNKFRTFILRIQGLKTDKDDLVVENTNFTRAGLEYQTLIKFNEFAEEILTTNLILPEQKEEMLNTMAEAMCLTIPKIRNIIVYGRYNEAIKFLMPEYLKMSKEECLQKAAEVTSSQEFKRRSFTSVIPESFNHVEGELAREVVKGEQRLDNILEGVEFDV